MSKSRSNWKLTVGILVCLLAIGVVVYIRGREGPKANDVNSSESAQPHRTSPRDSRPRTTDDDAPLEDSPIEEPEPGDEPPKPDPAVQKLEELNASGNIGGIEAELKNLATAGDLPKVEDLLKSWCQEGKPELVRACLDFSKANDPKLNMYLKVESIANPAKEIRDEAIADLEKSSGIRFRDVRNARMWAQAQYKR